MSNFVTIETEDNKIKLKNLYNAGIFIGFAWILFHFTIIFFFGMVLESILLVGLFLGIGNFVALLLDIPIGVLQKYIKPKTFLIIGVIFMIIVSAIFVKFVYFYGITELLPGGHGGVERTISFLGEFLNSSLNIILLLLSACLYGVIKESFDVTIISYIFNNSTPGEYASILSKYNIYNGGGSMIGLLLSGILLAMNIKIAIICFIFILVGFLWFIIKYFDNKIETIDFEKIKTIKLDVLKTDLLNKKEEFIGKINTKNLIELSRQSKVILLKPVEIKKSINFKEIYNSSVEGFQTFYKILFQIPRNLIILWFLALIMQFGFWDTFVATFLVEFLEKVISFNSNEYLIAQTRGIVTGYVLLGTLVIPAFLCQQFFINKSRKYGIFKVVMFGNMLSAISLICFGIFDGIFFVMLFGILNSVGYAATMPLAQATFSGIYNEEYAKKFNLKEIDTTVSAAPLKIVINTTNVIGLLCGSLLVKLMGFNFFFIIFGVVLGGFFIFSFVKMRKVLGEFSKKNSENTINDVDFV
ncbi:MAG: MFS transporter [Candidatus Altimarinota bacterium]